MNYNFGTREFMRESRAFSGVLCLHSAGFYFGYGTLIPSRIQILSNENPKTMNTHFVEFHKTKDLTNNLITFPSGNKITNETRTVLELMEYNPIDEYVSQIIEDYLDNHTEYELLEMNKQYNYCSKENYKLAMECLEDYLTKTW